MEGHGLSQRRACRRAGIGHSTLRYQRRRGSDEAVRKRLRELELVVNQRGWPHPIVSDNGAELTSNAAPRGAAERVSWRYIQPGTPVRNAVIESFNSKLRDERRKEHFFFGRAAARRLIEAWRQDYNQLRPHSSLGTLAPAEYANRQGGGPPEQAQGSAARPLAPPPHLRQNIYPGRYS